MKPMGKSLAAAIVVAGVTGCNYGAASFHCETNEQCGAGATCETTYGGLCSFPVDTAVCPSGRRFGELAGPQSNRCVGEQPPPIDAAIDAPPDAPDAPPDAPPDAQACFGGGIVQVCLATTPGEPLMIASDKTVDTSSLSNCAAVKSSNGDYCVLAGNDITITAKLRGIGSRPLVLIASGTISTTGVGLIDVGSHRLASGASEKGAGASPPSPICQPGTPPPATGGGTGGGAGGSFLGSGGNGGTGGNGGSGGMPAARVSTVTTLRGGCPGQDGQGGTGNFGLGGQGGGAVYLLAGVKIDIRGNGINAAGEGGGGGIAAVGGAGGGGSGGMIAFEAPMITASALLLASGAGGGGGAGSGAGTVAGANALDPTSTSTPSGGLGFVGNMTNGGNGGDGSAMNSTQAGGGGGGNGDNVGGNHGGGGGGGGGTGLISAPNPATLGTNLSPPRTP
jgi:hypothetical protein